MKQPMQHMTNSPWKLPEIAPWLFWRGLDRNCGGSEALIFKSPPVRLGDFTARRSQSWGVRVEASTIKLRCVLGNREKRLAMQERQGRDRTRSDAETPSQIALWLEQPAQRDLIFERVGALRQHDQQLLRELQHELGSASRCGKCATK